MTKKRPNCNTEVSATIAEIKSDIGAIADNLLLHDEKNFDERVDAIDFIEFQIIGRIESILQKATQPDELLLLKKRAEKIKTGLEKIDINLFKKLREIILMTYCLLPQV